MVRNIEYKFDSYKESHGRNDGVRVSQGVPKKKLNPQGVILWI